MKAMVLAAGLGTRLRPLTDTRPKALVEIGGRTLLEITLTRLRAFGVEQVIVNVHHLADRIKEYLAANRNFGMPVEVSHEEVLLDTGGGLKKAGWFFLDDAQNGSDEAFLLHNVDVISTIDLGRLVEAHRRAGALATLAVQRRDGSRQLLFDEGLHLCGRRAGRDKEPEIVRTSPKLQALAFTGIHVLSPRFLTLMTEQGVFSIIDVYLRLAGQGEHIRGHHVDEYYWRDLGKPEQIQQAEQDYGQGLFT
jgi:NDP-sugar pyrophosphorylase family protein